MLNLNKKKETTAEKWLHRIRLATGFKYSKTNGTTARFLAERLPIAFDLCGIQAGHKAFLFQNEVFWSGMPSLIIRLLKQRRIVDQTLSEEDRRRFIAFDLLCPASKKNLRDFVLKEIENWQQWIHFRSDFIKQLKNERDHWINQPDNPMSGISQHNAEIESSSDEVCADGSNNERSAPKALPDAFWISKIEEKIGLNQDESLELDSCESLQTRVKAESHGIALKLFEMLLSLAESIKIIEENSEEMLTRATMMHEFLAACDPYSFFKEKSVVKADARNGCVLDSIGLQPSESICLYEASDNNIRALP